MTVDSREGALEIIDKVISLSFRDEKSKERLQRSRKSNQRAHVVFFKVTAGNFCLETGSSSFTSISFR